ncbi:hypothetical protein KBC99_02765, partial [Candidatus Saccharibacteria bacterium]|nr:hypothetical protein [Candidatus Saccharibacteria bacterium]
MKWLMFRFERQSHASLFLPVVKKIGLICFLALIFPQHSLASGPNNMDGQGVVGIPYEIENCLDLQAVSENMSAYYRLANDIDCSGTTLWNGGKGFVPIGQQPNNAIVPFGGNFDGNGKTISDLYIDKSTEINKNIGLFEYLGLNARIHNFRLTYSYIGSGLNGSNATTYIGGIVAEDFNAFIDRVDIEGIVYQGCSAIEDNYIYIGGIAGKGASTITKSSSNVQITTSNCPKQQTNSGGIIGWGTGTSINDSSAFISMHIDSQNTVPGYPHTAGGLIGKSSNSSITSSYANGAIDLDYTPGDYQSWYAGGLIGYSGDDSLNNNFTMVAINVDTSCTGTECDGGDRKKGAIVGSNASSNAYSSNYYDEDKMG